MGSISDVRAASDRGGDASGGGVFVESAEGPASRLRKGVHFCQREQAKNLNMALFGDEATAQLYWKGATAWDSLTPEESFRFKFLQQQRYLNNWNAWRLKRDGANVERFRQQWMQLLENPGQRRFHEQWGRRLLERDPSMSEMVEDVYRQLENQEA